MYAVDNNGEKFLLDGTLTRYAPNYNNNVDQMDAIKIFNSGEYIYMKRLSYKLIVEERSSNFNTDTIFFRIGRMQKKTYQFEFIPKDFYSPGTSALLHDSYLKTSQSVNLFDTTRLNISINNDPASYAQDRFMLILKAPEKKFPLSSTEINSDQKNEAVELRWKSYNEDNIHKYLLQRSADNENYKDLFTMEFHPASLTGYQWTDNNPNTGTNYYRIHIINNDSTTEYSNTTEVTLKRLTPSLCLFPNPATSNNLNLKMINEPSGDYKLCLVNSQGKIVLRKTFYQNIGFNIIKINNNKILPPGIYHLILCKPSEAIESFSAILID